MIAIMEKGRRQLTVVVRTARGTLPLVVAASVAGASCGNETELGKSTSANPPGSTGGVVTDAGPSSGKGGALSAGGVFGAGGVTSGAGGDTIIITPPATGGLPSDMCSFTVELPPEGVPP